MLIGTSFNYAEAAMMDCPYSHDRTDEQMSWHWIRDQAFAILRERDMDDRRLAESVGCTVDEAARARREFYK
jgi:hypothetical protein